MSTITRSTHVPDPGLYPELAGGADADGFELASIRPEDLSVALETLIGNYSDPILAVIRELIINALDSHREAGNDEPVEIKLPTEAEPTFEVIDHGIGLTPTDMIAVFTHPAASTKRENTAATGELGIGAKAPFTIADRFEVIGTKNGVRATLVMARINDQLMHKIVEVTQSNEPDGVHVIVPVDHTAKAGWASNTSSVRFWLDSPDSTVITRGNILRDKHWNTPSTDVHRQDESIRKRWTDHVRPGFSHTSTVRMGQIAYLIPPQMARDLSPSNESMLFLVENKSLRIAPNREYIVDDAANRAVLTRMYRQWRRDLIEKELKILRDASQTPLAHAIALRSISDKGLLAHAPAGSNRVHMPQRIDEEDHRQQGQDSSVWLHEARSRSGRFEIDTPIRAFMRRLAFSHRAYTPQETVFIDSDRLSKSVWAKVSGWAKKNDVDAVVLSRSLWTSLEFVAKEEGSTDWRIPDDAPRFHLMDGTEVEWVDPDDIRQEMRAPKKKKAPEPTLDDTIEVIRGFTSETWTSRNEKARATSMTGHELVEAISSTPRARLIVGTTREIREMSSRQDLRHERVYAVSTGQRVLEPVRKKLHPSRIKTVKEHETSRGPFLLGCLTPAMQRNVADNTFPLELLGAPCSSLRQKISEQLSNGGREVFTELCGKVFQAHSRIESVKKRTANGENLELTNLTHLAKGTSWADEHTSMEEFVRVLHLLTINERHRLFPGGLTPSTFSITSVIVNEIEQIAASRG